MFGLSHLSIHLSNKPIHVINFAIFFFVLKLLQISTHEMIKQPKPIFKFL